MTKTKRVYDRTPEPKVPLLARAIAPMPVPLPHIIEREARMKGMTAKQHKSLIALLSFLEGKQDVA